MILGFCDVSMTPLIVDAPRYFNLWIGSFQVLFPSGPRGHKNQTMIPQGCNSIPKNRNPIPGRICPQTIHANLERISVSHSTLSASIGPDDQLPKWEAVGAIIRCSKQTTLESHDKVKFSKNASTFETRTRKFV